MKAYELFGDIGMPIDIGSEGKKDRRTLRTNDRGQHLLERSWNCWHMISGKKKRIAFYLDGAGFTHKMNPTNKACAAGGRAGGNPTKVLE